MTDKPKLSRVWCVLTSHDWDVVMVEESPMTMEAVCSRCGEQRTWSDYASIGGKEFPTEELPNHD